LKLVRLEARGFKSFGDKISLSFDDGVTAIVGPNGCGKSNIVDAIRWVLGEQSTRALRSEKMENVIFNGSQSRKAANLAEVSLTFDNTKGVLASDFTELTITRKLYRSGESEYRLNDVLCRLKDITDLFLDTGIGPDSYSIIELKMVEELISNKEGSRRSLFEEAAGISTYKVRKKQTFTRLNETTEDLNRVEDLLFELEKNLRSLDTQARRTERYYKLREQYRNLSIELAAARIAGFKSSVESLRQTKLKHEDERLSCQTRLDSLGARLEDLKLKNVQKEKNLLFEQKAVTELRLYIQDFDHQRKLKDEALRQLEETKRKLETNFEVDSVRLNDTAAQLAELRNKESRARGDLIQVENKLPALKEASDWSRAKVEERRVMVQKSEGELAAITGQIGQVENQTFRLNLNIASVQKDLDRYAAERETRSKELQDTEAKLEDLELTSQKKLAELSLLAGKDENLAAQIAELDIRLENFRTAYQQESRLLDSKQNELDLTKSLVENMEGFPDSIRFLKKKSSWLEQTPLIADIISCPEKYRVAIESFLGPWMNYFVVDTREEALEAVEILAEAEKGRVGFFVLASLSDQTAGLTDAVEPLPRALIPAASILETDPRYRDLVNHLFERVYLNVEGAAAAGEWELAQGHTKVIDSLGRYVLSADSLLGGSIGLFEGKRIGRSKSLERLVDLVKDLSARVTAMKSKVDTTQEDLRAAKSQKASISIKPVRDAHNSITAQVNALNARKENHVAYLESAKARQDELSLTIIQVQNDLSSLEPGRSKLNEEKKSLDSRLSDYRDKLRAAEEENKTLSRQFNETNILYYQRQNLLAGIVKDLGYQLSHEKSIGERIAAGRNELQYVVEQIKEYQTRGTTTETKSSALYNQLESLSASLQQTEEAYFGAKGDINSLELDVTGARRTREQLDALIQAIHEKQNQIDLEFAGLKERLSVEFNLSLQDISGVPFEGRSEGASLEGSWEGSLDDSLDDLRQRNEKIKAQLDTFGAINPLAVESYREMDERYQFIKGQKEDLVQAKRSLLTTINEIDQTANTQFLACFAQIRDNFILVFRSLFNDEDSCDLMLTEPANGLESDIEIIAKPKGKRPLTINQLSGGEKTLTATAILFSLYLLKPAPFCIFDEVDAPLDDTNIDKFNTIIRKFSESSQFIVVTHNKRTISSTDIIYGITMAEPGISKVVAVDLREVTFPVNAS